MRTILGLQQVRMLDPTILALADTSSYNPDLPVENSYLWVTPPSFNSRLQVAYLAQTMTLITSVSLGLSSTPEELYSGVYTVEQSIKPNDKLVKTHYFLLATKERICLADLVCEYLDEGKDPMDLFVLMSELDVAEILANQGECKKAELLFNLTASKIQKLCVQCVPSH